MKVSFETLAKKFQIGEPIKSLFSPVVQVDYLLHQDMTVVMFRISAPDSTRAENTIRVDFQVEVPKSLELVEERDELKIAQFLRDLLHKTLQHEADESITWNGKRIFDPHKARGSYEQVEY